MPNILNGNEDTQVSDDAQSSITYHQMLRDKNSNDNAHFIFSTGIDQLTSPDVPDYDYSQPVNQDEVSLFESIQHSIEDHGDEEEVNLIDCGKCDFLKEENRYAHRLTSKRNMVIYIVAIRSAKIQPKSCGSSLIQDMVGVH